MSALHQGVCLAQTSVCGLQVFFGQNLLVDPFAEFLLDEIDGADIVLLAQQPACLFPGPGRVLFDLVSRLNVRQLYQLLALVR